MENLKTSRMEFGFYFKELAFFVTFENYLHRPD